MARALLAATVALTLPLIVSCGAGNAAATSAPPVVVASQPTAVPTAVPTAGPAIGDTCLVGTWRLVKGRLDVPVATPQGSVTVVITGGAGELEHLFANGTYVYDEAGAPYEGSAHGYRVVVRPRGELRSPVIFLNGHETLEPINTSGDHTTVSLNGGTPKAIQELSYESYSYTCKGSSFTAADSGGDLYVYQRVATTP